MIEKSKLDGDVLIWGTGSCAESFLRSYPDLKVRYFLDNDKSKHGKDFKDKKIRSFDDYRKGDGHIIICSEYFPEIDEQLVACGLEYGKDFSNYEDHLIRDVQNFIISFPKCGRTWLRTIIGRIFQKHYGLEESEIMYLTSAPIECEGRIPVAMAYHDQHPHHRKKGQISNQKSRYEGKNIILMVRNPDDVLLSLYYHMKFRAKNTKLDKSEFVREKVGSLIDYYNTWVDNKEFFNRFDIVVYKKLHSDPVGEIKKVLRVFCPNEKISDAVIEEAIDYSSFSKMRKYEKENRFKDQTLKRLDSDSRSFKTRKGVVGSAKKELKKSDHEYIEKVVEKYLCKEIKGLLADE